MAFLSLALGPFLGIFLWVVAERDYRFAESATQEEGLPMECLKNIDKEHSNRRLLAIAYGLLTTIVVMGFLTKGPGLFMPY